MTKDFKLDDRAQGGFQNASHYDAHRMSYPDEAVEKLLAHLDLVGVKGAKIVDLGCGTGKLTELLAKREEDYEIVGVEPHAGMREELVKKELRGVEVKDGDAGHMDIAEGWADGLIASQAFHWFATEESLREIHRISRPGAAFGMIWNIDDYNAPPEWSTRSVWEQKWKETIVSIEDGHPRFRHGKWKEVFEKQLDSNPLQTLKDTFTHHMPQFSLPLGEEAVEWTFYLSEEAIWSRIQTLSQIANLEGTEKYEELRKGLFESLKEEGNERNAAGEIAVHGRTYMAWTSRV